MEIEQTVEKLVYEGLEDGRWNWSTDGLRMVVYDLL
jgi:hypothetical protein